MIPTILIAGLITYAICTIIVLLMFIIASPTVEVVKPYMGHNYFPAHKPGRVDEPHVAHPDAVAAGEPTVFDELTEFSDHTAKDRAESHLEWDEAMTAEDIGARVAEYRRNHPVQLELDLR